MPAPWIAPVAMGGISMLMNLFGGKQSAKANKEVDDLFTRRQQDLDAWMKKEKYTDIFDTDYGQSYLRNIRELLKDQSDINKQSAVRTGGTAEKSVAAGGELQKQAARAINQLAGLGMQNRQNVDQRYQYLNQMLANQKLGNLQNKTQNWVNFLGNTNSALGNLITAWGMGGFGGDNKGGGQGYGIGYGLAG